MADGAKETCAVLFTGYRLRFIFLFLGDFVPLSSPLRAKQMSKNRVFWGLAPKIIRAKDVSVKRRSFHLCAIGNLVVSILASGGTPPRT